MPRKQNGFGSSASFAFKGSGRIDKGKGVGAFGSYPSDRRYGSTVHRTVIENWNLNSEWNKWRRGYELYNRAAYSQLNVPNPDYDPGLPEDEDTNPEYQQAELKSVLYQGTPYEIETLFTAIEMPTMKSDVNTHYVVKRFVEQEANLGVISGRSQVSIEKQQRAYNEIWFKGTSPDLRARLILQMFGERLTDGETEATLKNFLTRSEKLDLDIPVVYKGKTPIGFGLEESGLTQTSVKLRVPIEDIAINKNRESTVVVNQGLSTYTIPARNIDYLADTNQLIGKIVYIKDFYEEKLIDDVVDIEWIEGIDYFGVSLETKEVNKEIVILDPGVSVLPPSMYDIATLPSILTATNGEYNVKGGYAFAKEDSQRFFEKYYLSVDRVKDEIESYSYSIFPFTILGAEINDGFLEITSIPFTSEIKLYTGINDPTIVFGDKSFVRYVEPSSSAFHKAINTNVDVWQDEVFTSKNPIRPAEVYSCDCASYSKTILAMPQSTERNEERKVNRQMRYPLPTALSANRFDNLGIDRIAGKATSWARPEDKNSFKLCKHTVTGMFVDGVQLIEPSQYPTQQERDLFEDKLEIELKSLEDAWRLSAERGGISLTEIVFSLSQGLNLDDVETGYVVLNSN